jgi:hypothetical protein
MADAPSPQSELASKKALNSFLFHAELLQFEPANFRSNLSGANGQPPRIRALILQRIISS